MNIAAHNRHAWDRYVLQGNRWTLPVSSGQIAKARKGTCEVVLTPVKKVPAGWFPVLKGARVLCLASGGGQQVPLLAATGARVTSFDNSPRQLERDRQTARENGLTVRTVQGDMRSIKSLRPGSFDLVFNPCSVCFVDNVCNVWNEAARMLKKSGVFMTGFCNPVNFIFDEDKLERGILKPVYRLPYSDLRSLKKPALRKLVSKGEALIWSHTLTDLIGGLARAGFRITDVYEDGWGDKVLDDYYPGFLAVRCVKT